MYMRGVWRPLTVSVVVGCGVLLPQPVATAAPSATNPVPCTAIDHHLVGTSGDVLGQFLNGQGCSITEQDGQGRVSVAQTSPPTGSRLSPAGFQSAAVASVAADPDTRSEKAPTDASQDAGSASGDSAEHDSGKRPRRRIELGRPPPATRREARRRTAARAGSSSSGPRRTARRRAAPRRTARRRAAPRRTARRAARPSSAARSRVPPRRAP